MVSDSDHTLFYVLRNHYAQSIYTLSLLGFWVTMSLTVKLNPTDKNSLENLQAKLKLQANIKVDQYIILGLLIKYGELEFEKFLEFINGISLTESEIKELESRYIGTYPNLHPEKSDDDLIYSV